MDSTEHSVWAPIAPRVQHYAWGDPEALPTLLGRSADGQPWAEAWYGAHPAAPSAWLDDSGREAAGLDALIAQAPGHWLGASVLQRWGRLPYLLKLLTAAHPLSIQVHPDAEQARAGYAREQAMGLPLDAAARCYRDDQPKPELVLALTPFDALCGFRPMPEVRGVLERLGDEVGLAPLPDHVAQVGDWLRRWYARSPEQVEQSQRRLLHGLVVDPDSTTTPDAVAATLLEAFGSPLYRDAGLLFALLLQPLRLQPGEALFLGPGMPHAYLGGSAVEVMAASDNVLRAGLTPKHVDAEALLQVLRCDGEPPLRIDPEADGTGRQRYATPAEAFEISALRPGSAGCDLDGAGPQLLLALPGAPLSCRCGDAHRQLTSGEALLIGAGRRCRVSGKDARAVVVGVPGAS